MKQETMKYIVLLILGIIVIVVALVLAKFLNPGVPTPPTDPEKIRFIRYLSCAIAMCSSTDPNDACNSPEVLSVPLEYEAGKLVKSCQDICNEIKTKTGETRNRYCDKNYNFNFTFKEEINFTSLDVRNYYGWKSKIINRACYDCQPHIFIPILKAVYIISPWGHLYSEGYMLSNDDCKMAWNPIAGYIRKDPGIIWLPNSFADNPSNCYQGSLDSHYWCVFPKDMVIWLWAKAPYTQKYWEWSDCAQFKGLPLIGGLIGQLCTSCNIRAGLFGYESFCPNVVTYTQDPSLCP